MAAHDQGYREVKAKLASIAGPYDPFNKTGDPEDAARYVLEPGVNFMRPWLAVRGGGAFQWPLGLEGFNLIVDPSLGIHKYIGGNAVSVEVVHAGEEHFTMTGNFPGNSGPTLVAALRSIVYADSGEEGKLLWLPEVVDGVQRVQVTHFEAARGEDTRGRDMTYSIDFVRMGRIKLDFSPDSEPIFPQPSTGAGSATTRSINVDAKHNTLRKIAMWKLGSATKWRTVYNANVKWFVKHNIPLAKAPDYRLPLGTKVFY